MKKTLLHLDKDGLYLESLLWTIMIDKHNIRLTWEDIYIDHQTSWFHKGFLKTSSLTAVLYLYILTEDLHECHWLVDAQKYWQQT